MRSRGLHPQDVAASYTVGAVSSVVYLNMLNRSIDGVAGDGGGGGPMAAQPRLLIPLIIAMGYNRCLLPPQRPAAAAAAPPLHPVPSSSQAASRVHAMPCSAQHLFRCVPAHLACLTSMKSHECRTALMLVARICARLKS